MDNKYQIKYTNNSPRKKYIVAAILSVVAIVAIGYASTYIFEKVSPRSESQIASGASLSAKEVVTRFAEVGAIASLSSEPYTQQISEGVSDSVIYKLPNRNYEINTPSLANVLYYAPGKGPDDTALIQSQSTAFMESLAYKLEGEPVPTREGVVVSTYTTNTSICQLTITQPLEDSPDDVSRNRTFVCVDKAAVSKQYDELEERLALIETNKPSDFTRAATSSVSEGNKSYSTIRLETTNTDPLLLFAAVDGKWEFIGDLSKGDANAEKYTVSPEIVSRMSAPKYGDFLLKTFNSQ